MRGHFKSRMMPHLFATVSLAWLVVTPTDVFGQRVSRPGEAPGSHAAGADPSLKDHSGNTPLQCAERQLEQQIKQAAEWQKHAPPPTAGLMTTISPDADNPLKEVIACLKQQAEKRE